MKRRNACTIALLLVALAAAGCARHGLAAVDGVDSVRQDGAVLHVSAHLEQVADALDAPIAVGAQLAAIADAVRKSEADVPATARIVALSVSMEAPDGGVGAHRAPWAMLEIPMSALRTRRLAHADDQARLETVEAISGASPAAEAGLSAYCADPMNRRLDPLFCGLADRLASPS